MNEDLKIALVRFGKFLAFFGPIFIVWWLSRRLQQQQAAFGKMSSDELRALAIKQPFFHGHKVVAELQSRNEDILFALPLFLEMVLGQNRANTLVGWHGLKLYFADLIPNVNFSKDRPSSADCTLLKSMVESAKKSAPHDTL